VQQHREQFTPALLRLQASVNETLDQLQQQERSLVEAQTQQLVQLQERLATDARCLLNSVELQAFVAQVQTIPPRRHWNQTEPAPEVDVNPANWQLAQTDFTVAIHNYEATVDHNAYDDERTHSAYGYEVTIQVGEQSQRLEILTQRVYSSVEQRSYSLRQQLDYYFEDAVAELLSQQEMAAALQGQLVQEISYLLGCAAHLLSLTPHQVQFQYSSTEATV
jgi:hypothetical protein